MLIKKHPRAPLYGSLGNIELILDATGLRYNTNNTYGTLSSGNVQAWKSIAPGPTGKDFNAAAISAGLGEPLTWIDGFINFGGLAHYLSQSATTTWDFMSYNAVIGNLKWTAHLVLKIGIEDIPNFAYSFFGNNGATAASKGNASVFDDRVASSRSDGETTFLSAGGGVILAQGVPNDLITPNVPFVLTIEVDKSQAAADVVRIYINDTEFVFSSTSPSNAAVSNPSFVLAIGSAGNAIIPFNGWISHFILQSRIESSGTRTAFVNSLLPFTRRKANSFFPVDEAKTYSLYNTYAPAGRYFFVQGLIQSPTDVNKIIQIFHDGNQHLHDNDKKVAQRISSDGLRTFASQTDVFDEDGAGTYAVQDGEWGWGSDGRIHGITDWHTSIGTPGGSHKLLYHYSDNDGASYTTIDISSVVPSDGLNAYRAHGNIIEGGDGFLYACLYKVTDEGNSTQSANYVLRKPVGSSTTWTVFTVRAVASTYISEMSIAMLDSTTLVIVARNEVTFEWSQSIGTSNGSSWTAFADVTFGESRTSVASPPLLTSFNIYGNRIICCWVLDKESATKTMKAIYGTAAAIKASGVSGWDTGTKTTIYTSATNMIHYGRVVHKANTLNAIGSFAMEPNPFTATENSLITFHCPATQYITIRTELSV